MQFISLFAGIGGLDLGLERAGMECVAQVEIDDFCQRVLQKHWPDVPKFKDVRDVGKRNLPKADAIVGGFPCQPHSTAGKRKGADDDRNLWPEYRRIIDELRPRWVIGENVVGIRTTILDEVLSDLERLDYSTITFNLPAAGFNAPHIRERIFVVAHAKGSAGRLSIPAGYQEKELHPGGSGSNGNAADANSIRPETVQKFPQEFITERMGAGNVTNSNGNGHKRKRLLLQESETVRGNWWQTEPGVCGVDDGVPDRVDRIRALGNAVVPQVAEFIGRSIVEIDRQTR